MSESERTKRMKYFLKQKFNRNDSDYKLQLQEEVSCGEYHRNRCDLAGIEYVNGKIHNSIPIHHKDSGLYIHCWDDLIADVEMIRIKIRRQYPEIPYVMLGFSLGSFILRSHQCLYPKTADKLIYVGTGQPKMNELKFAHWIVKTLCKKDDQPSKLVKKLAFDNYNRRFKHSKTGIDWLLKDEKAQEDYLTDERVVKDMTPRFFLQFLNGMMKIQSNEHWLYYKNDVLFIAGEEDPVSCGLPEVLKRYRRAGARITKKIISGYRHDVLHDSCKEKVFQSIEKFL